MNERLTAQPVDTSPLAVICGGGSLPFRML
jgi:hypothetical protein